MTLRTARQDAHLPKTHKHNSTCVTVPYIRVLIDQFYQGCRLALLCRIVMRCNRVQQDKHVESFRQEVKCDRLGLPLTAKLIGPAGANDQARTPLITTSHFR